METNDKTCLILHPAGAAANVAGNSFLGNSVGGYGNFGGASECCASDTWRWCGIQWH
jgi:hypothetical protein